MAQHDGISQISPKSSNNEPAALSIESTKAEASYELPASPSPLHSELLENETRARVERSASPILHVGLNDVNYVEEREKDVSAGRYFHYNIKPTGTYEQEQDQPERTQRARAGKTLAKSKTSSSSSSASISTEQPFLVQGDLRPPTSGSPISPSPSSTASSTASASATQAPHSARQNGNPDIQDIITGIVKLLNGNVNVHANTQGVAGGVRRPSASRINNRGPPRISEVQPLPIDYEAQKPGTSMRPPPYPFDRPERPFITGVPIPEQIVPVRPGFVSNRPPWYRNKPRPPITTSVNGSRRPLPQYQPLPAPQQLPTRPAQPEPQAVEEDARQPEAAAAAEAAAGLDAVQPTDTTYDSEFSNEDANAQYIEVSDQDTDAGVEVEDELQPPPEPEPETVPVKEKKKHKPKKPQGGHEGADGYTTIIETSSVVNTVMGISSSYVPMSMDNHDLDPSTEEVIFMTANRTPGLEASSSTSASTFSSPASSSIQTMPLNEISVAVAAIVPTTKLSSTTSTTTTASTTTTTSSTSTSSTSTTTTTTTEPAPTASAPSAPPASYHPRPGIVLDDPEFKPGGRPRPVARPAAPQQPIQPTRQHLPPGYGEIFDVTLSAIQGPGPKGSGSQQTINIKPYGGYGAAAGGGGAAGGQQADIIVSASGDEGFVSIDGKRTYINLFGDPTDPPAGAATTPATRLPQLPTSGGAGAVTTSGVVGGGVGGAANHGVTQSSGGYVVPETEIVELQPQPGQSQDRGQSKPATSATTNAGPTRPHYRQRTTQPPVRIDTCIVGDDSTCDQAQHERCKTDNGVSSCHCRPGE